jgi:hypothetical protein
MLQQNLRAHSVFRPAPAAAGMVARPASRFQIAPGPGWSHGVMFNPFVLCQWWPRHCWLLVTSHDPRVLPSYLT